MTFTSKPFYMIAICVSISKTAEMLLNKNCRKIQHFQRKLQLFSENVNGLRDIFGRRGSILTWMVALES